MKELKQDEGLRVKRSGEFKLKDKPNRQFQAMNLMKQFGFVPETIIIEKVWGKPNTLNVMAVLTDEEMKKEDKLIKNLQKKHGKSNTKEKYN